QALCSPAARLPPVKHLRRLVDALAPPAYPVLFHCQRGADRTGLASTIAQLLQTDTTFATARRQLGLRYGHLALGRPAQLDLFFNLYADYLRDHGLVHSRPVFRRSLARPPPPPPSPPRPPPPHPPPANPAPCGPGPTTYPPRRGPCGPARPPASTARSPCMTTEANAGVTPAPPCSAPTCLPAAASTSPSPCRPCRAAT